MLRGKDKSDKDFLDLAENGGRVVGCHIVKGDTALCFLQMSVSAYQYFRAAPLYFSRDSGMTDMTFPYNQVTAFFSRPRPMSIYSRVITKRNPVSILQGSSIT